MSGDDENKTRGKRGGSFVDLFSDATPLRRGPERVTRSPAPGAPAHRGEGPAAIEFQRSDQGSEIQGLAPGIDPAHLKRLRAGKYPIDISLDLHGLRAEEAAAEVRTLVAQAREDGLRCLRIIHGQGHHSEGEAVLKKGLPAWLAAPSTGRHILAFCSALPEDGGLGATYVLLRRRRVG